MPPRQCVDCHVNNNYNLTSTTCVSCHLKDFQGTTNPNHVYCELPADLPTVPQHHQLAERNLRSQHHRVPADRMRTPCRRASAPTATSTTTTTSPRPRASVATRRTTTRQQRRSRMRGFPTTCQQCHDTVAWTDGKFDHSTTGFVLTGAHTVPPRQCTDCHVNNNYNLTSTTCVSCHLKDFQGTTNPNHVSSNFPQTCQQCHNTSQLAERNLRPQHHRLPADRIAHRAAAAVYRLPREQQLQHHRDRLRELPPDRLQHGTQPGEPRDRTLPDDVRELPRHGALDGRQVRPHQHRIHFDWSAHGASALSVSIVT